MFKTMERKKTAEQNTDICMENDIFVAKVYECMSADIQNLEMAAILKYYTMHILCKGSSYAAEFMKI